MLLIFVVVDLRIFYSLARGYESTVSCKIKCCSTMPFGCSAVSVIRDEVPSYIQGIFNVFDSRQVCSE